MNKENEREAEWGEINRKKKEGSGEEPFSPKTTLQEEEILNKKETEKKLKDLELILISMRKEIGALGVVLAQHQKYFELLQKLIEQQKIEVVKN